MSVPVAQCRRTHGLPLVLLIFIVLATAARAGTSSAVLYLGSAPLVIAGLVLGLTNPRESASRPGALTIALHILVPLQILVTTLSEPGDLGVLALLGAVAICAWITATEVAPRLLPQTVERTLLIGSATLAVGYIAYQVPRIDSHASIAWIGGSIDSQWLNPNALALLFLIGAAVALGGIFSDARSSLHFAAGAICATALLLTFSRSGYLAFVVMLLVLALVRRQSLVAVASLALGAFIFLPESVRARIDFTTSSGGLDPSSAARLTLWDAAISVVAERPLLGSGVNSLQNAVVEHGGPSGFSFVHNSYLSLLAGFGLPIGFSVIGSLVVSYTRRLRVVYHGGTSIELAAVLAVAAAAVCSVFGEPLLSPVTIIPIVVLLGATSTIRTRVK